MCATAQPPTERHSMITLRELRFGIEIECGGIPREAAARAIQSVLGGYLAGCTVHASDGRLWKVVHDASLTGWVQDLRCEVVSPILRYADLDTLQHVIRAMRFAGAKVDQHCGIHIHVDASHFDSRHLAILARLTFQQEPLIYAALGISAARAARYAKPTDPAFIRRLEQRRPQTMDALNRLWYGRSVTHPPHSHATRYRGVNFHAIWDKGTVEFRYFESTLHAGKVKGYIQFVLAVAAKALNARAATSRQRTFDPTGAKYCWRCFLLRLGLIGDEFKTARKFLLALMPGDAAFRNGRPPKKTPPPTDTSDPTHTETPAHEPGSLAIPGHPEERS